MNIDLLLNRILSTVDQGAYLVPTASADPKYRPLLDELLNRLTSPETSYEEITRLAHMFFENGDLDEYHYYSLRHVIAAHPRFSRLNEAAEMVGLQEIAAWGAPDSARSERLASVDRHRGVLAFLHRQFDVALDYFTRALEREHSIENLGNVLCSLLRLGEIQDAQTIVRRATQRFPTDRSHALCVRIQQDPDLAALRDQISQI